MTQKKLIIFESLSETPIFSKTVEKIIGFKK